MQAMWQTLSGRAHRLVLQLRVSSVSDSSARPMQVVGERQATGAAALAAQVPELRADTAGGDDEVVGQRQVLRLQLLLMSGRHLQAAAGWGAAASCC